MNLYLISNHTVAGMGCFDNIIVAAETKQDALMTYPCQLVNVHWCTASECWKNHDGYVYDLKEWPTHINQLKIELLATNVKRKAGVVLASYCGN